MKQKTSKLSKIGRSATGLIIPEAILTELGWRKHQRVIVKKVPRGILIIDAITKHDRKTTRKTSQGK